MTPFEEKLAGIPRREIPPEWRGEILAAASRTTHPLPDRETRIPFVPRIAWGALAAAWVVIAILNFSGPRGEELYAVTPMEFRGPPPTARELLAYAEWQHRLLLALADEPNVIFDRRTIPHPRNL
jgi:hypothetical protein